MVMTLRGARPAYAGLQTRRGRKHKPCPISLGLAIPAAPRLPAAGRSVRGRPRALGFTGHSAQSVVTGRSASFHGHAGPSAKIARTDLIDLDGDDPAGREARVRGPADAAGPETQALPNLSRACDSGRAASASGRPLRARPAARPRLHWAFRSIGGNGSVSVVSWTRRSLSENCPDRLDRSRW